MYQILGKKRSNSRKFEKVIFESEKEQAIIGWFDNLYRDQSKPGVVSPYIFTHLGIGDLVVTCNYRGIICSPEKLKKAFENASYTIL